MEYHVIFIPLFPWETTTPKSLDDLKKLIQIAGRLFGFQLPSKTEESISDPINIPKALLS